MKMYHFKFNLYKCINDINKKNYKKKKKKKKIAGFEKNIKMK